MAKAAITGNSAYLWYPGDILMSERVDDLSATEECWYRRALDRSWLDDGIAVDPAKAAKRIGKKCTPQAAAMILEMFFVVSKKDATKMVNEKQELLRTKFKKTLKERSKAGIESARKRKEKKELERQQMLNKCATNEPTKSNNTIQSNTIQSKEEKTEEAAQAPSTPKRGTRLPEPFILTAEMRAWAKIKRPTIDPAVETEKFVNYFRAKTGRDATKLDWRATWNNWILNARDNTNGNGAAKPKPKFLH